MEGAALLSLLNRHLVMGGQNTDLFRRAIYKAADEHPAVLEQLYEQLHGRFAEMLRRGEALPDIRKDLACLL